MDNFLEGRYFDNGDIFVKVADPLCGTVTDLQNFSRLAVDPATLMRWPWSCPWARPTRSPLPEWPQNVQIVLQHAQPGKKGNLGNDTIVGLGSWRFDANLGKTFQISESKSLQVRFDAQNILNHPQPGNSLAEHQIDGRLRQLSTVRADHEQDGHSPAPGSDASILLIPVCL